jgi:hypothetical protein
LHLIRNLSHFCATLLLYLNKKTEEGEKAAAGQVGWTNAFIMPAAAAAAAAVERDGSGSKGDAWGRKEGKKEGFYGKDSGGGWFKRMASRTYGRRRPAGRDADADAEAKTNSRNFCERFNG